VRGGKGEGGEKTCGHGCCTLRRRLGTFCETKFVRASSRSPLTRPLPPGEGRALCRGKKGAVSSNEKDLLQFGSTPASVVGLAGGIMLQRMCCHTALADVVLAMGGHLASL